MGEQCKDVKGKKGLRCLAVCIWIKPGKMTQVSLKGTDLFCSNACFPYRQVRDVYIVIRSHYIYRHMFTLHISSYVHITYIVIHTHFSDSFIYVFINVYVSITITFSTIHKTGGLEKLNFCYNWGKQYKLILEIVAVVSPRLFILHRH